jgi:hypothetical protein
MAKTFLDLKTQARYRADMTNSNFIDATLEATTINDCARDLYLTIATALEDYYVAPTQTLTLPQGQESVAIPDDCFKFKGVDINEGSGWIPLKSYSFANRINNESTVVILSNEGYPRYRIMGRKLFINPQYAGQYRLWYIPDFTDMSDDDDELDLEMNRFWEIIALNAAIKYLHNEESDTSSLYKELSILNAKVESYIALRMLEGGAVSSIRNTDSSFNRRSGY